MFKFMHIDLNLFSVIAVPLSVLMLNFCYTCGFVVLPVGAQHMHAADRQLHRSKDVIVKTPCLYLIGPMKSN